MTDPTKMKIRIWVDQGKLMKQLVPGVVVQMFRQHSKSLIDQLPQTKEGIKQVERI